MTDHASNSQFDIAIIGAGFTGSTLAARLLQESGSDFSVVLIERGMALARGVAYGTPFGWHLLNVPASAMSAFCDQPDHFLLWAQQNYDSGVEPSSFVPRRVYGQYLESVLREAIDQNPDRFESRRDEAIAIDRSTPLIRIHLHSGEIVEARKVVLALGNFRPADPALPGKPARSARYFPYAWSPTALEGVADEREILLVGTGLTAVDTAIALRAREFRGIIHVLSRRGLMPRQHKPAKPWPAFWNENSPRTVRGLLRLIREQVKLALDQGSDWRPVFDSLRPFTARIWQSLPLAEQRRFLRHGRSYWEVHRHRVAPEIGGLIAYQLVNDQFRTHAGRILSYAEDSSGVTLQYRERRTARRKTIRVDRVINCTGPETDCRKLDDPLLTALQERGFLCPDPLFLGIQVAEDGAVIDKNRFPSDFLYTVGPARKARLWETTAVPEIREQVGALSKALAQDLARRRRPLLEFENSREEIQLRS